MVHCNMTDNRAPENVRAVGETGELVRLAISTAM